MFRSDGHGLAAVALCVVVGCASETDRLAGRLSEGTPDERRAAAEELGRLGPEAAEAVPALTAALADDDPAVQRAAAVALGRMGPVAEPAGEGLRRLLESDDAGTRVTAACALVEIVPDDDAPLKVLTTAAAREQPRAVVALGRLGPTAAPALPVLRRLARSSHDVVRSMAVEAIAKIEGG